MNPWVVRHLISPALERVLGRRTFLLWREMMASEYWPAERLAELQLAKFRELVGVALTQTRAYARITGLDPSWRPSCLEDLVKLPLLDKATMSHYRDELVNQAVPGGVFRSSTGGSSGEPLIFYMDRRRQAADKAARMRTHQWWGILPGDREAYLWGSPVELGAQDRLKRFRDALTNELLLSAFDLSEQSVGGFVDRLQHFGPACLFGYPSSIALLCRLARRAGLRLDELGVRVVFSTAEVLYDDQKRIISEALGGAPVVNGYGSREGGFIAHECPEGRMHIADEGVIVEFLKDARPVAPGEDGEIVLTNLDNHAMPFIRYRTGDVGQAEEGECPCGRGLSLMKVVKGRTTDFVIAPDGRWVHGLALIYTVRDVPGVRQYQIVQQDVDLIAVKLAVEPDFPADGDERIRRQIIQRLGSEVRVEIERVEDIPADASGKFRYVISQVARDREALL